VPTAMRLENELCKKYSSLMPCSYDFTITAIPSLYKFFNIKCINPFKSYFFSLVNLGIKIKRNPEFQCFCKAEFFKRVIGADDKKIFEECYEYASSFFKDRSNILNNGLAAMHHSLIKSELSAFQHLNHVFHKIKQEIPFPTMMLDWTTCPKIAASFGNEVFSIDKEKLFSMFRSGIIYKINNSENAVDQINKLTNAQRRGIPLEILSPYVKENIVGILSYKDEESNQLMVDQRGVTVFWPFQYAPDELMEQNKENNGLGYELDFRME
jgi:hypothetical protein